MKIACPKCATAYNVPDDVISDRPKKMRCTRCQHKFTVTRRQSPSPAGYVEFTGGQQLPAEFAFLQESTPESPPAAPLASSRQDPSPPASPASPASPDNSPSPSSSATSHAKPAQGGATPIGGSIPAESMFGRGTSAWEVEAPFDLDTLSVTDETPVGHSQIVGKIVFALILAVSGFLIFVAYRNNWSLSVMSLPRQVAFALSATPTDRRPASTRGIDATILSRDVVTSKKMGHVLVIGGEVVNENHGPRSHILLRGRLFDPTGTLVMETRLPCGKMVDETDIRTADVTELTGRFQENGAPYNCVLSPGGSTVFQVFFDSLPEQYNAGYTVDVTPIAAVEK